MSLAHLARKWKLFGLLLAAAWIPVTVTYDPGAYWWGAPVVVEDYPADVVAVDEGPYYVDHGFGFDFFYD